MKGSRTIRMSVIALAAGATALWMVPANASTGTATIAGSGTTAPGLIAGGGSVQSWRFIGSGALVTNTVQGTLNCDINGTDPIGDIQQGMGALAGTCTTPCGTSTVTGNFTRIGGAVKASGSLVGCFASGFNAGCTFVPTSAPPVTTFDSTCAVAFN